MDVRIIVQMQFKSMVQIIEIINNTIIYNLYGSNDRVSTLMEISIIYGIL